MRCLVLMNDMVTPTMYANIYNIDNLYKASHNALKNKKSKHSPAKFWLNEDKELLQMHQELKEKRYVWGSYSSFILNDQGVERRISVAPFRDRVLHHAIIQNIEPIFEKSFIYDTYANRKGKGTLNALKRAKYYANKYDYVLQLDIKKFFPSIEHEKLLELLRNKIECKDTMQLLEQLIAIQIDKMMPFSTSKRIHSLRRMRQKKGYLLETLHHNFLAIYT